MGARKEPQGHSRSKFPGDFVKSRFFPNNRKIHPKRLTATGNMVSILNAGVPGGMTVESGVPRAATRFNTPEGWSPWLGF